MDTLLSAIACIVVLYNPENKVIEKWQNYASDNPMITFIFVDNTPACKINEDNQKIRNSFKHYYSLKENFGIAKAQNEGIKIAKKLKCEYIVFFDQDSVPAQNLIIDLVKEFKKLSAIYFLGAIGPAIINQTSLGNTCKKIKSIDEVDRIISSGTCTSMTVLNEVGLMEEQLFIDLVDFEWCWRAKSRGYSILQINSLPLHHKIGLNNVKFLGINLHITAPIRYYYIYRNTRKLLGRNYVPFTWKSYAFRHHIAALLLIPFCKEFKGKKISILKNAFKGIFAK